MKRKRASQTEQLNVRSEDLERVIGQLAAARRRILSAEVTGEDRYALTLSKPRRVKRDAATEALTP